MVLCSGIAENKCTAIPTPQDLFEDYIVVYYMVMSILIN